MSWSVEFFMYVSVRVIMSGLFCLKSFKRSFMMSYLSANEFILE